jgi:hypothetical protein
MEGFAGPLSSRPDRASTIPAASASRHTRSRLEGLGRRSLRARRH